MISAIVTGIIQFINKDYIGYTMLGMYLFIVIALEWAFFYDKITLQLYYPSNEKLDMFFKYFKDRKISYIKYNEIITWLSRWVHYYFCEKTNGNEQSELILKLELLFRPGKDGLCLAVHHKSDFINLCKVLCQHKDNNEKLNDIIQAYNIMLSKEQEEYKILKNVFLDKNILWYIGIMILHVVGCTLICENVRSFWGNLFLYIPGDCLVLLVYIGIIKQQKENHV